MLRRGQVGIAELLAEAFAPRHVSAEEPLRIEIAGTALEKCDGHAVPGSGRAAEVVFRSPLL